MLDPHALPRDPDLDPVEARARLGTGRKAERVAGVEIVSDPGERLGDPGLELQPPAPGGRGENAEVAACFEAGGTRGEGTRCREAAAEGGVGQAAGGVAGLDRDEGDARRLGGAQEAGEGVLQPARLGVELVSRQRAAGVEFGEALLPDVAEAGAGPGEEAAAAEEHRLAPGQTAERADEVGEGRRRAALPVGVGGSPRLDLDPEPHRLHLFVVVPERAAPAAATPAPAAALELLQQRALLHLGDEARRGAFRRLGERAPDDLLVGGQLGQEAEALVEARHHHPVAGGQASGENAAERLEELVARPGPDRGLVQVGDDDRRLGVGLLALGLCTGLRRGTRAGLGGRRGEVADLDRLAVDEERELLAPEITERPAVPAGDEQVHLHDLDLDLIEERAVRPLAGLRRQGREARDRASEQEEQEREGEAADGGAEAHGGHLLRSPPWRRAVRAGRAAVYARPPV